MAINDGGPAFPTLGDEFMQTGDGTWHAKSEYGFQGQPGMTLRDFFAAHALTGMLAYSMNDQSGNYNNNCTYGAAASIAYRYADAMLAAREQTTTRKE